MFEYNNGEAKFTCDICGADIEQGYIVGDEIYCRECMLEYIKTDVCESLYVNEEGREVECTAPDAELAYKFHGNIFKEDESGTFDEILLDYYVDDMVTVDKLIDDYIGEDVLNI